MGKLVLISWIFLFFSPPLSHHSFFSPGPSSCGWMRWLAFLSGCVLRLLQNLVLWHLSGTRGHCFNEWDEAPWEQGLEVCSSSSVTVIIWCCWCLSVAVLQLCALHGAEMTMEGALPLCHSNLSNVLSLRCLHREITSLPMEGCLNVPLEVRRSNTVRSQSHGWDHFLLRSKVSGGHIYYLIGFFFDVSSLFFLMSCQKINSYFSSNFTKPLW